MFKEGSKSKNIKKEGASERSLRRREQAKDV
jgi:hypothetical protein